MWRSATTGSSSLARTSRTASVMVDASQLSSKSSRESALPVHAWTWARVFFLMSWQTSARKPATTTLSPVGENDGDQAALPEELARDLVEHAALALVVPRDDARGVGALRAVGATLAQQLERALCKRVDDASQQVLLVLEEEVERSGGDARPGADLPQGGPRVAARKELVGRGSHKPPLCVRVLVRAARAHVGLRHSHTSAFRCRLVTPSERQRLKGTRSPLCLLCQLP